MLGMLRDRPRNNTSSAFVPNMAKGLVAGTRVMTLDGELPVQFLTVRDLLITRSGTKRLRAVTKREVLRTELRSWWRSPPGGSHDMVISNVTIARWCRSICCNSKATGWRSSLPMGCRSSSPPAGHDQPSARSRSTPGRASVRSSAIRPGPKRRAAAA